MSKERQINRWKNIENPKISNINCYICNFDIDLQKCEKLYADDMFNAGLLERNICPNCDVIFGDLRFLFLPKEEIANDYIDVYLYFKEGDTTNTFLNIFKIFNFTKNKSYLDYACGNFNNHINILKNIGYDITGYDPYVGNFNINIEREYDIIISNNYIEHVINPYIDLQNILKYLKKDGLLVLSSDCWIYTIPITHYHTFFFVGRSISYLENNLNIKMIYTTNYGTSIIKVFKKL